MSGRREMSTAISRKSHVDYYQRAEAERANPDSRYWLYESKATQATLEGLIGDDAYEAWAELVWPGDTIDGRTWKQIHQQTAAAVNEAMQGERDIRKLADAALHPEQNVPGCYGL